MEDEEKGGGKGEEVPGLIVFDEILNQNNLKTFMPLLESSDYERGFSIPQVLVLGFYPRVDSLELAKLLDIPSRYIFNLSSKDLQKKVNKLTISKDSDKSKALLSFFRQHLDGLGRESELSFVKEESFRHLLPIVVLSDSKKERDRLSEGFFSLSLKIVNLNQREDSSSHGVLASHPDPNSGALNTAEGGLI